MKLFILSAVLCFSQKNHAAIRKNVEDVYEHKKVVVAVIDTGVDIDHADLKKYIWKNSGESGKDQFGNDKENNHIDDDGNGFIDDVHGWNFVDDNNNVMDRHGHGTHISGIIKNQFRRRMSTTKGSSDLQLMVLKYYSPEAKDVDNISFSNAAIRYANKMKANLINYSGGGQAKFSSEYSAIQESQKLGILFVAAAGNSKDNIDFKKYYPANYNLTNIIAVAATDQKGDLVSFSNYGFHSVDIAAPGQFISSTLPHNQYGIMSGTSQATAFVSGWIAGLYGKNNLRPKSVLPIQAVLAEILKRSSYHQSLQGKTKYQLALISP